MIHDEVGHDFHVLAQRAYVIPSAEPRVDFCVVDRIETGIGAINRIKKRKQVHAAEYAFQRPLQQVLKFPKTSSGKTIDICDQLRLILHGLQKGSPAGIHSTGTSGMNVFSQSAQSRMPWSSDTQCPT